MRSSPSTPNAPRWLRTRRRGGIYGGLGVELGVNCTDRRHQIRCHGARLVVSSSALRKPFGLGQPAWLAPAGPDHLHAPSVVRPHDLIGPPRRLKYPPAVLGAKEGTNRADQRKRVAR